MSRNFNKQVLKRKIAFLEPSWMQWYVEQGYMAIIISLEPCSVQTHTYPVYLCTCIYPLSTRAYNNNLQVLSDAAASTVEPFRTSTFPYKQMSSDFPSLLLSLWSRGPLLLLMERAIIMLLLLLYVLLAGYVWKVLATWQFGSINRARE